MALYLIGVYESVLDEIRSAQETKSDLVCYLQPFASKKISALAKDPPGPETPIRLYISTTTSLPLVSYQASLVAWELKSELTAERLAMLNEHIDKYQPGEQEIYFTKGDSKPCVNLISIVDPDFSATRDSQARAGIEKQRDRPILYRCNAGEAGT